MMLTQPYLTTLKIVLRNVSTQRSITQSIMPLEMNNRLKESTLTWNQPQIVHALG